MKEKRLRYGPPGSPPQVRGKRQCMKLETLKTRITPAGAGKTLLRRHCTHHIQDHPRRCGENFSLVSLLFAVLGSPRRCGENLYFRNQQRIHRGSPPQVRGKLVRSTSTHITDKDHPRRCGENVVAVAVFVAFPGSPPQVRGKRGFTFMEQWIQRITPAGAGKTEESACRLQPIQDHPRRCGENLFQNMLMPH